MKKKQEEVIVHNVSVKMPLEEIMGDRFGRYSKYIIQDRALPDARDGLKPVQRRILYCMYHHGNTFDHAYRKSAKTVGLVIGNYHPHGDSSVYDAMVRLSQNWKMRIPLVDMQGNNGSIDDDPAAAMRYTEARLSEISSTMLEDIDKDTIEWAPNFDDTENEPTVLPARFPVLLVNGATGIAAGYATNIAPHNLNEVVEATIYRIQFPTCSLEEIMQIMPGPDFPTGGIVQGKQGIIDAFTTGKGRVVVRAKSEIVETKTIRQIIITEIPYEVIKSNLVKKMDEIRLNKDIDGIIDIRDETDHNGLRIVVDLKKDVDPQLVLNYFYKNTDLQIYYNYNTIAIVDKRPMQLGIIALLDAFINHREEVVIKRSQFLLDKMEKRCHILEGLMKAVSIMDEIIEIIRSSKDKADAKRALEQEFGFSEEQSEAIVTLRLYRLTNTDVFALREEFAQLVNEMEYLNTILSDRNVLKSVIVKELKEIIKKYGQTRKTVIEDEVQEIVIDKLSMITNERVMVTCSRDGYVKRVSMRSFGNSALNSTTIKEGDQLVGCKEADTLDTLLLFTSKGNYAYLPVYQIEEARWKDLGSHLNKYVKIDGDDKIINAILVKNFNTYAWITTVSRKGMIKKSLISNWVVQRNNKLMPAMNLKAQDEMICALITYEKDDVAVATKNGYVARYSCSQIPTTGLKSQGVIAIKLNKDDEVVSASMLREDKNSLLIISDSGSMKRIKINDLTIMGRPVKGEMIVKKIKSKPYVIAHCEAVNPYDQLCFFTPEYVQISAKEVTMMSKESTFSNPLSIKDMWYEVKGIDEVEIIDTPQVSNQEEESHNDIEMIQFEL